MTGSRCCRVCSTSSTRSSFRYCSTTTIDRVARRGEDRTSQRSPRRVLVDTALRLTSQEPRGLVLDGCPSAQNPEREFGDAPTCTWEAFRQVIPWQMDLEVTVRRTRVRSRTSSCLTTTWPSASGTSPRRRHSQGKGQGEGGRRARFTSRVVKAAPGVPGRPSTGGRRGRSSLSLVVAQPLP